MESSAITAITALLERHAFRFTRERELQDGIARVLEQAHIPFHREASLDGAGTIDFLVGGGLGLEVKIAGTLAEVTRQLHRYADHARVDALVLVTSRLSLARLPRALAGKPLSVVHLGRSWL